jgi:tetratricopeptide (TPR) repeat protein
LAAVVLCALPTGAAAASSAGIPKELVSAQKAFESNSTIGDSLAGKPASIEQVSDAESFYQEAVTQARRVVADSPGIAEAHLCLGLILCTGYRAVQATQPQGGAGEKPKTVFALVRGGSDCEEGLGELRTAMKSQPAYQVQYAGALLVCGDATTAEEQAVAAWKLSLPPDGRADCARILAQLAQAGNRKQDEIRWLREIVKYDPQDGQAGARLAKLAPPPPAAKPKAGNAIAWVEYETGIKQAEKQKRLVLAVFTAAWCPTCQKLDKEVLQDRSVIATSRQFICIRVDVDEQIDVKTKHAVSLYPTTLVLDSDGNEWLRLISFSSAEQYAAELKGAAARAKGAG